MIFLDNKLSMRRIFLINFATVQAEELKRAIERAELAESKLKGIEEELQVGIMTCDILSETLQICRWLVRT